MNLYCSIVFGEGQGCNREKAKGKEGGSKTEGRRERETHTHRQADRQAQTKTQTQTEKAYLLNDSKIDFHSRNTNIALEQVKKQTKETHSMKKQKTSNE